MATTTKRKLLKIGLKRVKGFMYYIKEGGVWAVPRGGGKKVRVERFDASIIPPGTLCYIDKDGDLACAPRAKPGAHRKAKRGAKKMISPRALIPRGARVRLGGAAYVAAKRPRVSTDRAGHGILRDARGRNPQLYLRPQDATAALVKSLNKLMK